MKRAPNLWGRKNNSLFDTNLKMREDMDYVELVLGSSAIPESGTASVKARPTVKLHPSSGVDSFQGYAVPTPKVPVLPPLSGPKINGSVGGESYSSGSVISVPDLVEGEIVVPPPPSMAPPPPPGTFILPPPDFFGDLNSLDGGNLQPPSTPTPKPPSLSPSMEEEDFIFLKPPPMAPPKPPSTCSSGSTSSLPIFSPPPDTVPEHPKFAPPQPPTERQHKIYKAPPQKPMRLSSIPTLDSPPQTPAPPPPVQTPTLSTFNPKNTAKLYNIPKTSFLSRGEEPNTRPKQILLLEDSRSVQTSPVHFQVDRKAPKSITQNKPVSKDTQEVKENLNITQNFPSRLPDQNKVIKTRPVSALMETKKPLQTLDRTSPQLQRVKNTWMNSKSDKDKLEGSSSKSQKFSPLLDRKLRNLKSNETSVAREGTAASPLALLMAAKEREKHRSNHILSMLNGQPSAKIHPSDNRPNFIIVNPKSSSPITQNIIRESPKSPSAVKHTPTIQTLQKPSSPALAKDLMYSTNLNGVTESQSATYLATRKQDAEQSPRKSQSTHHKDEKEELSVPLLPPPPQFEDLDEKIKPPPSISPPNPPRKNAPTQNVSLLPPAESPSPPLKPKPPEAPKVPPPVTHIKPKPLVQTKPKVVSPLPPPLSSSQTTLLSILQKKMLEMDHKIAPVKEAESNSDEWGTPSPDEANRVPVVLRATPKIKNDPVVNKAATLDMQELEDKVARKSQETSPAKAPTSNGVASKPQYGCTFKVRPGTRQPITLVNKGDF